MTPKLPSGAESLLDILKAYPHTVMEIGTSGFVRLKGYKVEGMSFRRGVWDDIAAQIPVTVQCFAPSQYGSKAYLAALTKAKEPPCNAL